MSTHELTYTLKHYYRRTHTLPSIREFCTLLGKGFNYRTQAKRLLDSLVMDKFLAKNAQGKYIPGANFFAYELYHGVKAGGFTAASDLVDYVNLEEYLVRKPNQTILVTVNGDSMIGAGLNHGDVLVVETGSSYKLGQIVVAELNGEYTVKYYHVDETGTPYLKAANPNYADIRFYEAQEVKLIGLVKKAIKNFD